MKKFFTLFAVAVMAFAAQANVLSVGQDTWYSGTYPVYGLWYDTPGQSQMIYPADMLAEMADGDITELSFLTLSTVGENEYGDFTSYTIKFSEGEIQLALMEVDQLGFEEEVLLTGAQVVATTVPEYGAQLLTFQLDEPFHYNGGNLLVDVTITSPGGYGTTYFLGTAMVDENDNDIYTPSCYVNYGYSGDVSSTGLSSFLPAIDFTYEPGTTPVEPPVEEGIFIVLIDQEGNEVQYTLNPSANNPNNYVTMVTLEYNPWGAFDPNYDERPNVPFYFLVNGQRLGAEVDMTPVLYGEVEQTLQNPLFENENCYTVPVGYTYTIGIQFNADGTMYVLCAQGPRVGVDELNADKAVAGVRYFNMAGQEMQQAEGLTIVVTTYTDGTTSAVKVMK